MEEHAIPRQITTFEFKLIGVITVKQFLYLLLFGSLGYVVYALTPIQFFNILSGVAVGGIGAAIAFLRINERPLDIWIKNLITRLISPSQYYYDKNGERKDYDPLPAALIQKAPVPTQDWVHEPEKEELAIPVAPTIPNPPKTPPTPKVPNDPISPKPDSKSPILSGYLKNKKDMALPNIMVYIKDDAGTTVRILRTDEKGYFATFQPLAHKPYVVQPVDIREKFFFDTMAIDIDQIGSNPITLYSKEIL